LEKLYVNEIRPSGEVSTVGLFYSRAEAENVVAQLCKIPEKSSCRYEIADIVPLSASTSLTKKRNGPPDD
jgi:hypothetical protein